MVCPCGREGCFLPEPVDTVGIVEAAAEAWVVAQGYSMATVRASDNRTHMVELRRRISVYLRAHDLSYSHIGRFLDRDHSAIQHLVKGNGHAS